MKKYHAIIRRLSKFIIPSFWIISSFFLFSSCFTGIESTKKISLSREDRKQMAPTPEELFFSGIPGVPLEEWGTGKSFLASDDRAILIFDREGMPPGLRDTPLGGKKLYYDGLTNKLDAAGNLVTQISFTDGLRKYLYNTGKPMEEALKAITSDQIPMLIDLDLIEKVKEKLLDVKLWTRSPLWYDNEGERIDGKKFVAVTIIDIKPGNLVFPVKLLIEDASGTKAWMYMNLGISGNESRSFNNIFYISDPKKNYPNISPQFWELICKGDIAAGMTKEECKLSLGNPSAVNAGHDYSHTLDIWSYENGTVLWFEDGILTRFRN